MGRMFIIDISWNLPLYTTNIPQETLFWRHNLSAVQTLLYNERSVYTIDKTTEIFWSFDLRIEVWDFVPTFVTVGAEERKRLHHQFVHSVVFYTSIFSMPLALLG